MTAICSQQGDVVRRSFYLYFLLLISTFCVTHPTTAWTETPSFSEWHDTMEKAFKDFQGQEDKLLAANSAKTLTWEKGLRQRGSQRTVLLRPNVKAMRRPWRRWKPAEVHCRGAPYFD